MHKLVTVSLSEEAVYCLNELAKKTGLKKSGIVSEKILKMADEDGIIYEPKDDITPERYYKEKLMSIGLKLYSEIDELEKQIESDVTLDAKDKMRLDGDICKKRDVIDSIKILVDMEKIKDDEADTNN